MADLHYKDQTRNALASRGGRPLYNCDDDAKDDDDAAPNNSLGSPRPTHNNLVVIDRILPSNIPLVTSTQVIQVYEENNDTKSDLRRENELLRERVKLEEQLRLQQQQGTGTPNEGALQREIESLRKQLHNQQNNEDDSGGTPSRSSPLIGIVLFLVLVGGGGGGLAYFFLSKNSYICNATTTHIDGTNVTSLSGSPLPTCLGDLTQLTVLWLGSESLTGRIPTQLGSLTALTWLYLHNNQLTGTIPTQLGSLTALRGLNLGENQLTGTIPTQLGSLTALTELYLYDNQLTGTIPEWVSNVRFSSVSGNNNFVGR